MITSQKITIYGDWTDFMRNFITSGDVRRIMSIQKRPINGRTLDRIIDAKLLEVVDTVEPTNTRLFDRKKVEELASFLPKKRMPSRYSIVEFIKERMKEKDKSIHGKIIPK